MEINNDTLINKNMIFNNKQDYKKYLSNNMDNNMDNKNIEKIGKDFESFFLNQMMEISMKNMKIAGEGSGSDIVKSMYVDAITKESSGSFGVSSMIMEFLESRQNKELK